MRWLDGITDSMHNSLGELRELAILGSGRFPGVETGNLLQYSSLENSMDREACWAYSLWVHKEADTTELLSATKKTTHPHLPCSGQLLSHVQLCDPMDCSTPGFPVHDQLLQVVHDQLAQTHVHQVSDAIQPSHPLSSPSPPAFILLNCGVGEDS